MVLTAVGLVLLLVGYGTVQYMRLNAGLTRSDVLASGNGTPASNGATNILVMGLDSRTDEKGNALSQSDYAAMHTGSNAVGGRNSNVLMLLHLPADGSKAVEISIPRDDYVAFPGCPDGQCHGKIKEAYGLAADAASRTIGKGASLDKAAREQKIRDAGRRAEIDTVSQFLGGVRIDHFVEVTMVGFYQLAKVVQPITVCVNENTSDSFSGAKFHAGRQQVDAAQALAFVRQRRDAKQPQLNFTDMDRQRRQQAFIASLATQLKQAGTLADPSRLSGILDVVSQEMAVDSGLNLLSFAGEASNLAGGHLTFYTLPIDHFGRDPLGQDVNIVDLPKIQATVAHLLGTKPPTVPTVAPSSVTVDVANASGVTGEARRVAQALHAKGYGIGATTSRAVRPSSVVLFGKGADVAANQVSALLSGVPTQESDLIAPGSVRVVLGSDFRLPADLGGSESTGTGSAGSAGSAGAAKAASAVTVGKGAKTPPPTVMSALSSGGIPCVK